MKTEKIDLGHGEGGRLTHELINDLFKRHFSNTYLDPLCDAAVLPYPKARLAFTTDSYVVQPIFFPGGDIGKLAVCGTINDLSMVGAVPLYLTAGYILEEGIPYTDLERIVSSMAKTAAEAGTVIVAGDTKVVGRGSADKIFINTAGIGWIPDEVDLSPGRVRAGDRIIISGSVGDHGMAILCQREGLEFTTSLASDCAPLNSLVRSILDCHKGVRVMRDPTRGGLATTLVELAQSSGLGFEIEEIGVPVGEGVRAGCELLGLDPFYLPNEGKLVLIADPEEAESVVTTMRGHLLGREAGIIGQVVKDHPKKVALKTIIGVRRVLEMLTGAQLPRIC
ncbi:MAG: hydrogenase expression/formation protein HypE [Deltaproteobacteria bacterium]|nr:hydrogenase expression/formation protein HypE [Deltaproteobacteria bacterium]